MYKLIFILFFSINAMATNIEYFGGNITYKHLFGTCSGFAHYEITVNLYTKKTKTAGDSIKVDGAPFYAKRTDSINIGNNILKSIYKTTRVLPGCGNYIFTYTDTINIQSVKNINLLSSKFSISTQLVLNPFYAPISSFTTFCNPATKIFKNKPFTFNTIASTSNTLVYDSIIHSLFSISSNPTYSMYIPNGVKINRYSGEIQWMNPDTLGNYVFMPITKMYKDGYMVSTSTEYYKFEVINNNPSYVYDSICKVPVNTNNFKEIIYTVGNTYSFTSVYTDLIADSVKTIIYPIDFFNTSPTINLIKNSLQKNTVNFSWSPVVIDDRLFPYNFVINSRSYYGLDSVANSYQTVSFKSSIINAIKNLNTIDNNLLIYPNPTNNFLYIKYNTALKYNIEIIDIAGRVVYVSENHNTTIEKINIEHLAKGSYIIKVTDKENTAVKKLILN